MGLRYDVSKLRAMQDALGKVADQWAQEEIVARLPEEFKYLAEESFSQGRSPAGSQWATLKHRVGRPLRHRGHLMTSIHTRPDGTLGLSVYTDLPYAAPHQFGAPRNRWPNPRGPRAPIPARPFLPADGELPDAWQNAAQEVAQEVIESLIHGA
jgi:phage virion morphogenesis protein